jgi:serine/threonine-protein kinase RsbT
MTVAHKDALEIRDETQVVRVRQVVREWAAKLGFSLVEQTKVVTAASELARNTVIYGGGGVAQLETIQENGRRGLRVCFVDEGPGIPDIELALRDGFTTGSGLGLGLGGAKRLVHELDIDSAPGRGTRITMTRWK